VDLAVGGQQVAPDRDGADQGMQRERLPGQIGLLLDDQEDDLARAIANAFDLV